MANLWIIQCKMQVTTRAMYRDWYGKAVATGLHRDWYGKTGIGCCYRFAQGLVWEDRYRLLLQVCTGTGMGKLLLQVCTGTGMGRQV